MSAKDISKGEVVRKPWGRELIWAKAPRYVGKVLTIEKGHRLSLQYHKKKHESLIVLRGRLLLRLGRFKGFVGPGTAFAIRPRTIHRFEAPKGRVTLVEVSTPELWDVVRLKDDYKR